MKQFLALILALILIGTSTAPALAIEGEVLGVHILGTQEIGQAQKLINPQNQDQWSYVTIPFSLENIKDRAEWQSFFDHCQKNKIIPIVRLVTKFDGTNWVIPTRKDIADQISFLNSLNWPTSEKHLIIYNEPNHKAEWGGIIDPAGYARTLQFASLWAKSEDPNFVILPAAMDLAAPNGNTTLEAFNYLGQMIASNGEIFDHIDYWNSHSYPNPGFSSSPTRYGKNSLRGFIYELDFIKQRTGQDLRVFITETGWRENIYTQNWLDEYYQYAYDHIWSDSRVIAVTPFVLHGDPGPFSEFAFFDQTGNPTKQYEAFVGIERS